MVVIAKLFGESEGDQRAIAIQANAQTLREHLAEMRAAISLIRISQFCLRSEYFEVYILQQAKLVVQRRCLWVF